MRSKLHAVLLVGVALAMSVVVSIATPQGAAASTRCDNGYYGFAYEYTATTNGTVHCTGTQPPVYAGWGGVKGSISAATPSVSGSGGEADAKLRINAYYGGYIEVGWFQGTWNDPNCVGRTWSSSSPTKYVAFLVPAAPYSADCGQFTLTLTPFPGSVAGNYAIEYQGGQGGIWQASVPGYSLNSSPFIYNLRGRSGYVGNSGEAVAGIDMLAFGSASFPTTYFGRTASLQLKGSSLWTTWGTSVPTGVWDVRYSTTPCTVLSNFVNFYYFEAYGGSPNC